MFYSSLLVILLGSTTLAFGQQQVQVPEPIKAQVAAIQDRFVTVLEEECGDRLCYPVGCQASHFDTLDERQTSSLPGLEDDVPADKVQYRLTSVVCEFTYEEKLSDTKLVALKQRLAQKVKQVGVNVQIRAKTLAPKAVEEDKATAANREPRTWQEAITFSLLPFIPWLLSGIIFTAMGLALIWALRRLGKPEATEIERSKALALANAPTSEPTPYMLLTRINQLGEELRTSPRLVEQALKKSFEEENFKELSRFLQHFGPEPLAIFKDGAKYKETLAKLSAKFSETAVDDSPSETWAFLGRLERQITAAKVRTDHQPLDDEFNFLAALSVDEFLGILREVDEIEAIAAIAHAPRRLREKFFAHANPAFTAKFIEQMSHVEKLPDALVRETAKKLRAIYDEKGEAFRTIQVDSIPLLEQAFNSLEPAKRRELFLDLGKENPDFVKKIAPAIFLDDSVPLLPDDLMTEIFLTLTPSESASYLSLFSWGNDVLARLKPRLQEAIRSHQTKAILSNPSLSIRARGKLAAIVKEKDQAGIINLRSINAQLIGK